MNDVKSMIEISGQLYEARQFIDILDFHEKEELIEMLEDIAFVYAVYKIRESKEFVIPGTEDKILFLQELINAIRAVTPIES